MRRAGFHCTESGLPFPSVPMSSTIACNKDAFPTRWPQAASEPAKVGPAKTSRVLLRKSSSAIRLSFALRSQAAQHLKPIELKANRARFDPRFGTYYRHGSRPEPWFFARVSTGPAPISDRNVVAPGKYSKRFLQPNSALSCHFSTPNRPRNTRQIRFWGTDDETRRRHQTFNLVALAVACLHNQNAVIR
jgi:hypothetical protein